MLRTTPRWFPYIDLVLLALILVAIPVSAAHQHEALEQGAAQTLSALGSVQLAYQDMNLDKDYGSFLALQYGGYVGHEVLLSAMIPEYEITRVEINNPDYRYGGCGADGSFTIVATPDHDRGRLRTFSICDDQTVRVAPQVMKPEHGNPCNWEPMKSDEQEAYTRSLVWVRRINRVQTRIAKMLP